MYRNMHHSGACTEEASMGVIPDDLPEVIIVVVIKIIIPMIALYFGAGWYFKGKSEDQIIDHVLFIPKKIRSIFIHLFG